MTNLHPDNAAMVIACYQRDIARLRGALETARRQLVTLGGGWHDEEWGDKIQAAVLREIDAALNPQKETL